MQKVGLVLVAVVGLNWQLVAWSADVMPQEIHFFARKNSLSNEFIGRKGVLVKRSGSPATVLLLHGYGLDRYALAPLRIFLKDLSCLSIDFRAHGDHTADQESTLGYEEVNDIFGAVEYIRSDPYLSNRPLIVIGFWMGAVSAIEAQSLDSTLFTAMFLDTPFSSSVEILRRGLQAMRFQLFGYQFNLPGHTLIETYAFNPYVQPLLQMLLRLKTSFDARKINTFVKPIAPTESIRKIEIPAFFVVTKNDTKVSVDEVKSVYDHKPGFKRLWIANGRDHCDAILFHPEKYERILNDFIYDVLTHAEKREPLEEIIYDQPQ